MGIGAAIGYGLLRGTESAARTQLDVLKEEAKQRREDSLAKAARTYQTQERIAGQDFAAGQNKLKMQQQSDQFEVSTGLTKQQLANQSRQIDLTAEGNRQGRELQRSLAIMDNATKERMPALQAKAEVESIIPAKTAAAIETAKGTLEATQAQREKTSESMVEMAKNTQGFDELSPQVQSLVLLEVGINDNADVNGIISSLAAGEAMKIKAAGGAELKGPTAAILENVQNTLAEDPVYKNANQYQKLMISGSWALKYANPKLKDFFGTKDLADGAEVPVAEAIIKGQYSAADFARLTPPSQQIALDTVKKLAGDMEKKSETKSVLSGPLAFGNVDNGPISSTGNIFTDNAAESNVISRAAEKNRNFLQRNRGGALMGTTYK